MPKKTIPAVSIIIPMYNAEKYIGECLDSILAQTFKDFEVIVVDDCSTDKSCAIVESYLPKFNKKEVDKLQLIRSAKNSGGAGTPRNIGIHLSRGKYVLFVDSDDAITKTALDELYPLAKKFDADVVYCEKFYRVDEGENFSTDKNSLKIKTLWDRKYNFVTEPKIISYDIVERIKDFVSWQFAVSPWNYLIRRELIVKHNIQFPNMKNGEDNLFVLYLICFAKTFVRVPNVIYVYRILNNSVSHNVSSINMRVSRYADHGFHLVSRISKFAEEFTFLKNRPDILYAIFEWLAKRAAYNIMPLYSQIPAWQLEPLIMKELDKLDDENPLTAFLCNRMNIFNLQLNQSNAIINQMNAHIQKQNQVIQQLQAQVKSLQAN